MDIAHEHFVERDQLKVVIYKKRSGSSDEECADFVVARIKSTVVLDKARKMEVNHQTHHYHNDASSDDDDDNSNSSGLVVFSNNDISPSTKYLITVTHDRVVHGCMVVCVREEEPTMMVEEERGRLRSSRSRSGNGFLFDSVRPNTKCLGTTA
jgi:hypothetical protein